MDKPTFCEWKDTDRGVICIHCKSVRSSPRTRICTKSTLQTPQQLECKYLGKQLEIVLIKCRTCCGNVKIKYPVNECQIKNTCLPTYFPPEKVMEYENHTLCIHCPARRLTTL